MKKEFFETKEGSLLKTRLNRITIYSIILLIFGIYFIIDAYLKKDSIAKYIYGGILIGFAFLFLIGKIVILKKKLQQYVRRSK